MEGRRWRREAENGLLSCCSFVDGTAISRHVLTFSVFVAGSPDLADQLDVELELVYTTDSLTRRAAENELTSSAKDSV